MPCADPSDCAGAQGTYCDVDAGRCACKPDYPVTDTRHCYKGRRRILISHDFLTLPRRKPA